MISSLLILWPPGFVMAEEMGTLYRGIRPLGMGGAFITLSNDANALFYNPAGLNDIKGFGEVNLANPLVEVSENTLQLINDVEGLEGQSASQVTDFLNKNMGKQQHARVALFPGIAVHNFAIGVLGQGTADILIQNPAFPSVEADVKLDVGVLAGVAYGFLDKRLQVGITGKFIQREGERRTFTVADIVASKVNFTTKKAEDWAIDVGAKASFPVFLKPTLALVVQNVTDLDFSEASLGVLKQQVNIGASVQPDFWILKSTFAVQIDDLTKEAGSDKDLYKRTHIGAELRFPKILTLLGGINQGYLGGGVILDFWILQFAYVNYAEELGTFAGQTVDRRHVATVSLGF